jgi:hypothetical protein
VGIRLVKVHDSGNTISAKALITYIIMTVPVANFLAADLFGTCIFH